jgi:hypothetical protein
VKEIRKVDENAPIVKFESLKPLDDSLTLYSFHLDEPYEYTNHGCHDEKYSYPGKIDGKLWNKEALEDYMKCVVEFQKAIKFHPIQC